MTLPKPYYQDDRAGMTIYHGDCREIIPQLNQRFDLVLTDPPYGVGKDDWDSKSCEWIVGLGRKVASLMLITTGIANMFRYPSPDWVACYCRPNGEKRAAGGGINCWEPVLIYGKNPFALDCRMFKPTASIRVDGHATPKPLSPWAWLIAEATAPTNLILDPVYGQWHDVACG